MNKPLVSVGIPTYNRPEGINNTLSIFTKQTYKNLEIIVSDNCSENNDVKRIVRSYEEKDKRVNYYRQDANIGAANNFKYVLEKSNW
ncbi:hypothetical protein ES708_28657 [subsurface metagenome]